LFFAEYQSNNAAEYVLEIWSAFILSGDQKRHAANIPCITQKPVPDTGSLPQSIHEKKDLIYGLFPLFLIMRPFKKFLRI
jgi:hypothetical protein